MNPDCRVEKLVETAIEGRLPGGISAEQGRQDPAQPFQGPASAGTQHQGDAPVIVERRAHPDALQRDQEGRERKGRAHTLPGVT